MKNLRIETDLNVDIEKMKYKVENFIKNNKLKKISDPKNIIPIDEHLLKKIPENFLENLESIINNLTDNNEKINITLNEFYEKVCENDINNFKKINQEYFCDLLKNISKDNISFFYAKILIKYDLNNIIFHNNEELKNILCESKIFLSSITDDSDKINVFLDKYQFINPLFENPYLMFAFFEFNVNSLSILKFDNKNSTYYSICKDHKILYNQLDSLKPLHPIAPLLEEKNFKDLIKAYTNAPKDKEIKKNSKKYLQIEKELLKEIPVNYIENIKENISNKMIENTITCNEKIDFILQSYYENIFNKNMDDFKKIRQQYFYKSFGIKSSHFSVRYAVFLVKADAENVIYNNNDQLRKILSHVKERLDIIYDQELKVKKLFEEFEEIIPLFESKNLMYAFLNFSQKTFELYTHKKKKKLSHSSVPEKTIEEEIKDIVTLPSQKSDINQRIENYISRNPTGSTIGKNKRRTIEKTVIDKVPENFVKNLKEQISTKEKYQSISISKKIDFILNEYYEKICINNMKEFKKIRPIYFSNNFDLNYHYLLTRIAYFTVKMDIDYIIYHNDEELKGILNFVKNELDLLVDNKEKIKKFNMEFKDVTPLFDSNVLMHAFLGISHELFLHNDKTAIKKSHLNKEDLSYQHQVDSEKDNLSDDENDNIKIKSSGSKNKKIKTDADGEESYYSFNRNNFFIQQKTEHQATLVSNALLNRDQISLEKDFMEANNMMSPSLFLASRSLQDSCSNSGVLQDITAPTQDSDEKLTSNMLSNKFKHFYDTPEIPNLINSPLDNTEYLSVALETNNLNTFWSTNYLSQQRIDYNNENEDNKEIRFLKEK